MHGILIKDRLRLRVYGNKVPEGFEDIKVSFCAGSKNKTDAYHIYVNSRPLVRELYESYEKRAMLRSSLVDSYFAGRFDGDGSISKDGRYLRIVYGSIDDLRIDRALLEDVNTSVYIYRRAGTYCLYFSETTSGRFLERIGRYSISGKLS
jgi:hypothetical protein